MVPEAGIEPARPFDRGILSPLRLPIPPLRQRARSIPRSPKPPPLRRNRVAPDPPARVLTARGRGLDSASRWGRSSVGRVLEWHSRGRGFDSRRLHHPFPPLSSRLLTRRLRALPWRVDRGALRDTRWPESVGDDRPTQRDRFTKSAGCRRGGCERRPAHGLGRGPPTCRTPVLRPDRSRRDPPFPLERRRRPPGARVPRSLGRDSLEGKTIGVRSKLRPGPSRREPRSSTNPAGIQNPTPSVASRARTQSSRERHLPLASRLRGDPMPKASCMQSNRKRGVFLKCSNALTC